MANLIFVRSDEIHEQLLQKAMTFHHSISFVLTACCSALSDIIKKESGELLNQNQEELVLAFEILKKDFEIYNISVEDYYKSVLFIDLISNTEIFFIELLKCVLIAYPNKIGSTQFKLKEILDVQTKDELVLRAAEEFIYKLTYKKPKEFLNEMCKILSVDPSVIQEFWPNYIEAKARRDLGVHNNWVCNATYINKTKEIGLGSGCEIGQLMHPSDREYSGIVADNIINMSTELVQAVYKAYS